MIQQQPGRETKSRDQLHRLDPHGGALQAETSASPFEQQVSVLAPDGALRAVCANGNHAEQRVQIEPGQRTGVTADSQVALDEGWLSQDRQKDSAGGSGYGKGRGGGVHPGNGGRREGRLKYAAS